MGTDEVTEITEADFTKVAGVTAPANRVPFVLLKAKGTDDVPAAENEAEADKGDGESHKTNTESPEANEQQEDMTDSAAKGAHDEGAFCGDVDCVKCVIKDGASYRLRSGVEPVTKAARQSRAYWDAVIKGKADPNAGAGVERDKIPAEDFAGKSQSFPIVTPQDADDAARSIGLAGREVCRGAPEEVAAGDGEGRRSGRAWGYHSPGDRGCYRRQPPVDHAGNRWAPDGPWVADAEGERPHGALRHDRNPSGWRDAVQDPGARSGVHDRE